MLNTFVIGLATGALYAVVAMVFNIMYSTSKVLSLTTGHMAMLGGVFGAWMMSVPGFSAWVAFPLTLILGAVFGLLTEVIAIRRVLRVGDDHLWVLSTLALGTAVQHLVALWWGTEPKPFARLIPQDFSAGPWDQKYWLPIGLAALAAAGLVWFYRRTMLGHVFTAVAEDPFAARARGIAVERVRAMSFALAGMLGAMAGFAAGQLTFAFFALGIWLTLSGFIALATGGLGSNAGALVGGSLLGLFCAFSTYFFGAEYQQTVSVGLLLIVLLLKPAGLFGKGTVRPV
ncbi:branched-chain amino acid ABC transporter permease [Verminephrobacter eiseniae]|uniref:branched-chain amino acid ABC transporter permease n=1 Tax=Verminephrobacter eiseniae TaxID=364317 RepID=UPI0010D64AB9|nr:branched-chain amino acid ABC transporter permease [Verminephrobacter eiseniae]KAB7627417.1 branched-chain amino acid ABC transporter permease [Verminephrobacter sp. Larva24]MCW5231797.1 branched-chain amino acid ABC transporter permease [Verminephrobacter eiseniae]MCW5260078.1 branched-chain amino acid ABC transporter permease [Verminephrobacter eiseniae]MCW5293531.1 branched-chain amino acid ABC transporter permease [Verminephrobacter eiseniae]MCW8186232.1 branched-chain amino acid ABC tr